MDESVECFYCNEEIEDGTVVQREVFLRNVREELPDSSYLPGASARAAFPRQEEVTWTWHPACEPSDWAPKQRMPWWDEPDLPSVNYRQAPLLARLRVLLRWNVMDRLRYLGLWPRRWSSVGRKMPSGSVWEGRSGGPGQPT